MSDRDTGQDGPSADPARGVSTRAIRAASEAELLDAGTSPGLLRVTVGLEDVEDLQADFAAAMAAIPDELLATREPVPALGAT